MRFLQLGAIQRVGSDAEMRVDVRIIEAINRDLEEMILQGTLREDLYYRLNVIPICHHCVHVWKILNPWRTLFLRRVCERNNKALKVFTRDALIALSEYPWPGNVRQLENVVERLVVLCRPAMT